MSSSTAKRVRIERFDREDLCGWVNPLTYLGANRVELMSPEGELLTVLFSGIKLVRFVRSFEPRNADAVQRAFRARPKMEGLWVRLIFTDYDFLEAVVPNDLLSIDARGFTVIPPDFSYTNQRVFVPREALKEARVLGVIGRVQRQKKTAPRKPVKGETQIGLFDGEAPADASGT